MNNILNIKTPCEKEAEALKADFGLDNHGLTNLRKAYWNLTDDALYEEFIFRGEGRLAKQGPMVVNTGAHSARAANDKFIVREATTEDKIWWGEYNRPISPDKFDGLWERLQGFLQGRDVFVQDTYCGADPNYRLPVRVITEFAWHNLFARNMLLHPATADEYKQYVPEFTIVAVPSFKAMPQIDGTRSPTFIALNFEQKLCIIGVTAYGGEIKKSAFTIMNYLLPLQNVLSMHCSANIGKDGDAALFFGLSGTGKTTLSADPKRSLIGDDEHGWTDEGVFNFENGCYAKVIQLNAAHEPQIFAATRRYGTILENVVMDPVSRRVDLDDDEFTENTRASYPLEFIDNAVPEKKGGHPKNIIFLTCDASGVMPPIARLTEEQAMYHFISGYTSKIAGTEVGLGKEPEITFSACFGAPFMVHHPAYYAELLRNKMRKYNARVWLVNTGWVGGPYGVGERISIRHTRNLLNAALEGALEDVEYYTDSIFGFKVPTSCPEVPENVLYPSRAWGNDKLYFDKYKQLAARFLENFKKFAPGTAEEVVQAGPKVR
ncbi:phosphoenolpyruvate carboxykinase (ATP) [bacterium]|nr:phosphoenolpyruvate carboxykinase (ATP) [bacterium]